MKGLISAAGDAWNMSSWTPKNGDAVGSGLSNVWNILKSGYYMYNILIFITFYNHTYPQIISWIFECTICADFEHNFQGFLGDPE